MKRFNRRKAKKDISKLSRQLRIDGYFEDCNYNPCKVITVSRYFTDFGMSYLFSAFVEGQCLVNDNTPSCSLYHCRPLSLTEKEAFERADYYKVNGRAEYLRKYVYIEK